MGSGKRVSKTGIMALLSNTSRSDVLAVMQAAPERLEKMDQDELMKLLGGGSRLHRRDLSLTISTNLCIIEDDATGQKITLPANVLYRMASEGKIEIDGNSVLKPQA